MDSKRAGTNYSLGYTTGVFDLFHCGHVVLLERAKSLCDRLIVGLSTDECASYKGKIPIIPYEDREMVVKSCKYVDAVVPQENMNKMEAWKRLQFNVMFVGDDWYQTEKWREIEGQFNGVGVRIVYFPYTRKVSSTLLINEILERARKENRQ